MKILVLVLIFSAVFITYTNQQCTEYQYTDGTDCEDCVLPCLKCTDATTCTECDHAEMILSGGDCNFCPDGQFYDSGTSSCDTCDVSCDGMCYGSATNCTRCDASSVLNMETLACEASCSGTTITIDGKQYCRGSNIYIDSSSTSPIELGTMDHPYKTIDQAFIEVFNYWPDSDPVDILVKEATTNNIYFQERPLIVNRKDNVQIMTYTEAATDPQKATLNVLNTETYSMAWTTAYSLMGDKDYDFSGAGSSLQTSEISSINSDWYAFIIIQCDFLMDGFIVNNDIKLEDDDFAIVNPIANLAERSLTINNCEFEMYGTVMAAFTSVSFYSTNVTIDTYNLVGGFVFLVSCDPTSDVVTGEVVIDNLTFDGARSTLFKYGGIYMTGPQNFTIQNSYIGSYGFMFDAKQLTRADSPLNCQPNDGVQQTITLQNNVYNMSLAYTGTPHHGFICSFLEWYPRQNMEVYFTNNTMVNIQKSFYRMLLLEVTYAKIFVSDNTFMDSTSSVDVAQLKTTKDVEVTSNTFQNISSTSQNILVIANAPKVTITDLTMNGAHPDAVSSAVVNLNTASGAEAYLSDIKFTNNDFLGTKAIVSQQLLSYFSLTESNFDGDQLMQNTNYIDIQKANRILISNTTFTDIVYQNEDDSGSYLIYIAKKTSISGGQHSYIRDLNFNNIKTNAISFGGFTDSETDGVGDLIIMDVIFTNSTFNSPDSLIVSNKYSYSGASNLIIQDTDFIDLTFTKFGNLIEFTHNAKQPVQVNNVTFNNIYGAGIHMEPQDIFDTENPLTLAVTGCTFESNTPWVSGFLNVFENSIVTIEESSFNNTYSVGSGSVILANYKENSITISNSNFTNNYAILGGVFYSQFSSSITCNSCMFENNLAIRGGLAFLNSNGKVILNNSTITQNQALNAPILYISACQADYSVLSNSQVYENKIITMDNLLIKNGTGLEHINDDYVASVESNRDFYEKSVSGSKKSGISMIKGKVRVEEGCEIYNQPDFLATFESEIEIIDTTMRDITLDTDHIIFHLLSSTFTFTNSTMNNINCPNMDEAVFQVRLESTFTTEGSESIITNSTCQFAFLLYSFAYLKDMTYDTANLGEAFIDSIESTLQFTDTTLKNINTTANAIVLVENSVSLTTNGSEFLSGNQYYFSVIGSTLTFENTVFDNQMDIEMRAATFEDSTMTFKGSTFKNLKFNEQGGAIDTLNSNVEIDGSTFENNSAPEAGGIALRCEEGSTCTYSIKNSIFTNNTATTKGGAIYYDFFKPTMSNNTFTDNSAQYGPNVAAYPVKIMEHTVPEQTYVSGQEIEKEIKYKLVDPDGLTIATDSDSVITIAPANSTNKVIGNTDVTVVNGIATFTDVTFISSPGAQNIAYTVSSSNIDETKIDEAFGMALTDTHQTLTVDFRDCIKGEEQKNDMCTPCPTGKYSLIAGATECKICPKHATCYGEDVIWVDAGYWRASFASDTIHECLNENACLKYEGTPADQPYNCRKGYASNLCDSCVEVDGTQYQRTGDHQCGICPDIVLNFFRLFGLLVLLVIFVIIIIWSNIRTKKESPQAILIRILTNYFQIITSAASFNLTFPSSLEGFFEGVKTVGESAKIFLSVDCFVQNFPMVQETNTTEYFKAFMTGISPLIFVGVVVLGWLVVWIFKRYTFHELKNRMIISIVIVLFLLHPSITGMALGLFNCYEIESGQYWLFKDLSIRCWQGTHPAFAFGLGIPMIILWIFGLPLAGFLIIRHYRNRLDEDTVLSRYRILFQGYKREAYYWEFVNIFRKVAMVMINTFLGIYPPIYKTFVATLTLAIILRQQEQIQPYKIKIMNEAEFRESTTSIVTLFGGMFFILEDLPGAIKVLLVIVIFACNIWFYSLWLHLFFKRSRFTSIRLLAIFFGKVSCLGKDYWQEEHKSLQSNHDMDFVFGKYDAKDTKYKQIEEESKDQSFAGYAPQDNIINDLSAGDSNTASLKGKDKDKNVAKVGKKKEGYEGKTAKEEAQDGEKEGTKKRKKKKKIIRRKKGKKGAKNEEEPPNYEEMENDELEQQINEELDGVGKDKGDDQAEADEPAPKPKKSGRKKKKKRTARKNQDVFRPEDKPDDADKSQDDNLSADEEAENF